eukprot:CFRG5757T1
MEFLSINANPASRSPIKTLKTGTTWSLQAWGPGDDILSSDEEYMVDVDMESTNSDTIKELKSYGHYVVCYIDVGTAESWRSDYEDLLPYCSEDATYEDEKWLDLTQWKEFSSIMKTRFKSAQSKGCDGVETDNTDGYTYGDKCVPGETADSLKPYAIEYAKWLADTAHDLEMSIGLKNTPDLIQTLIDNFDFGINESCLDYNECDLYKQFKDNNKALFGVEYKNKDDICSKADEYGITMKYKDNSKLNNC